MIPVLFKFPPRKKLTRWSGYVVLMAGLGAGLSLAIPGCSVGYLLRSSVFQAELMLARVPVDEYRQDQPLTENQARALDDFADVKEYGKEIGLSSTRNYDTIAANWPRRIWNITACDPVAFEPKRWWFPIVGSVPYLGFFRSSDAKAERDRLRAEGLDVYVRGVGAYSTLGWFEDPILPWMLKWPTDQIAQTTLHELTHATVWIPGSVKFNESFANFVGKEAAIRYLESRYGADANITIKAVQKREDSRALRLLLHQVYQELDAVYTDETLGLQEKLDAKGGILQSIEARVRDARFHDPDRIVRAVRKGDWNNARMIQFKAYNQSQGDFQALLDSQDGDLLRFMNLVREVTEDADNPFEAIREATR